MILKDYNEIDKSRLPSSSQNTQIQSRDSCSCTKQNNKQFVTGSLARRLWFGQKKKPLRTPRTPEPHTTPSSRLNPSHQTCRSTEKGNRSPGRRQSVESGDLDAGFSKQSFPRSSHKWNSKIKGKMVLITGETGTLH